MEEDEEEGILSLKLEGIIQEEFDLHEDEMAIQEPRLDSPAQGLDSPEKRLEALEPEARPGGQRLLDSALLIEEEEEREDAIEIIQVLLH
jgi:hypothetical protein